MVSGNEKVINLLIQSKANLNVLDSNGHSPAKMASWLGMKLNRNFQLFIGKKVASVQINNYFKCNSIYLKL